MDDELIRCPSCRGRKQVEKLGGVLGDCNTCQGKGKIKSCDKPLPPMSNHDAVYGSKSIIEHVSNVVPNQVDPLESAASKAQDEAVVVEQPKKNVVQKLSAQGKRAVFKRKKE